MEPGGIFLIVFGLVCIILLAADIDLTPRKSEFLYRIFGKTAVRVFAYVVSVGILVMGVLLAFRIVT